MTSRFFERTTLAGTVLENRILRAATHEALGDSYGRPRRELVRLHQRLAANGVGAIIPGFSGVMRGGRVTADT